MYTLMLLNGGIGSRVAAGQPKQLLEIWGIPILVYSLVAADAVPEIERIVLNYPEGWRSTVEDVVSDYAIRTPVTYVDAGATRHESVALMVQRCTTERVIIHEAARPLVTTRDFAALIAAESENVSMMSPIPFTVAPVDPRTRRVTGSLERDRLRNVQLPQKFRRADLVAAHDFARERDLVFTEDATLLAVAGFDVFYVDGSDRNFKVTTATDVKLATALLRKERVDDV